MKKTLQYIYIYTATKVSRLLSKTYGKEEACL